MLNFFDKINAQFLICKLLNLSFIYIFPPTNYPKLMVQINSLNVISGNRYIELGQCDGGGEIVRGHEIEL